MADTRRTAIFKKKWCGHVALGGIAAAILLALSFALYWPHSSVSIEKYSQYKLAKNAYPRDQDAVRESRVWLGRVLEAGRPETANKKDEAAKPDSEKYTTALDLSAQWSTAVSTAEMVALTRLQILIGIFGIFGLGATVYYAMRAARAAEEAAIHARDQATIIHREFIATHRPKLIMRQALSPITDPLESTIVVQYTITNVGDSEAWITNSHMGIQFIRQIGYPLFRLPPEKEFPDRPAHVGKLVPGQTINCVYESPSHRWEKDYRLHWCDDHGVFFTGHITYIDAPGSSIKRQMSFRRKYDINSQRFVRIQDAPIEDEYAD